MNNKVSVIIPSYNAARFLDRTVNSVLNQTYKNTEIVLVDDGSVDDSADICRKLQKMHNSIVLVLKEKNEGQTASRNDGIKYATGDWMIFLDSDDVLPTNAIEKYVEIAEAYNPDIIFSNYETINSKEERHEYRAHLKPGSYTSKEFGTYLFDEMPMNILTCIGAKMYSMDFVRERKDFTETSVKTNYDMAFVIDSLLSCDSIYYLDEINYTYLLREDSVTYSYRKNMYETICYARRRIREYLEKCDSYEEKKLDLEMMQYSLIRKALSQEIRFNKGYDHFKSELCKISISKRTKETVDTIMQSNVDLKYKLFMKLVGTNQPLALYTMLKLKGN